MIDYEDYWDDDFVSFTKFSKHPNMNPPKRVRRDKTQEQVDRAKRERAAERESMNRENQL